MLIRKINDLNAALGNMIGFEFNRFAAQHQLSVNYTPFHFVAEEFEEAVGLITGHAYYNEVCISDLILLEKVRKKGIGSKLLQTVEDYFSNKGYDFITLTTYEFQAPDFYVKNSFEIEYIRTNKMNPKLTKYFFRKEL